MNSAYNDKDEHLKIVYRGYGIADRFPDGTMELNKHLKKYPDLHQSLIRHEARHSTNLKFNRKDLLHDLSTPNQINTWKMMKFMVRHPFSLFQFAPFYYSFKRKTLIVDYNCMLIWGVIFIIVMMGLFFGNII